MPKYRINCSTTRSYTLLVEAPTKAAAQLFYDSCDAGVFNAAAEGYDWQLDDLHHAATSQAPDVVVNEEGEEV